MKKSLLALAVLGAFAGAASAQSSVTIFGVVDMNLRNAKNGNNGAQSTMGNDGLASSRFGARGIEDLGGGLKAGFFLDHRFNSDTGALNSSGKFWHGRSTVSLIGNFGEVRLGRDLNAGFLQWASYDPFGTNGVASLTNVVATLGSGAATFVRTDNMVQYFLPALGGVYGTVAMSPSEGVAGNKSSGGRIGYAAGPVDVSVGAYRTETGLNDLKLTSLGGSYKVGPAKLSLSLTDSKFGAVKQKVTQFGASATMGQGELRGSITQGNMSGGAGTTANASDSDMLGLGYIYNLSTRTAFYGTYARIKNKGSATLVVPGGIGTAVGLNSTGYEAGVKHSF